MDKELTSQSIGGLIRHVAGLAAGALVANGWIDESMTQQAIGAISGILIISWSVMQKRIALERARDRGARL